MPLQYLVFMMFAFYGYNRHAFLFADIIRTEQQLYTASGWVVVLVVLDVLSTSVTAHVIKQYHVRSTTFARSLRLYVSPVVSVMVSPPYRIFL